MQCYYTAAGTLDQHSSVWPEPTGDFAFDQELGGVGTGDGNPSAFLGRHHQPETREEGGFSVAQPPVAELHDGGVERHVTGVSSALGEVRERNRGVFRGQMVEGGDALSRMCVAYT